MAPKNPKVFWPAGVNPRKYKIAQHPDAIDTEWDLEPLLHLFPADPKDGSRPSIVRTATKLNGVGIGFETTEGIAERRAMATQSSQVLADRGKILKSYIPIVGRQRVELMGRMCYRAGTVLNHQMRNNEPSIAAPAMQHAAETQTSLFKCIIPIPDEHLPTRQFGATEGGQSHTDRRVPESVHLDFRWYNPTLEMGVASAARVIDVLQHLRKIPHVARYIPTADQWASSGIPILKEAAETITKIASLKAFLDGPPVNKEAWAYVHKRLIVRDKFDIRGIEDL
jgi:hypothetical protein